MRKAPILTGMALLHTAPVSTTYNLTCLPSTSYCTHVYMTSCQLIA